MVAQPHDPQPDAQADEAVHHLHRRLHPGHGARRPSRSEPVRPIWMDVAERQPLPGLRHPQGHGQQGQVHLPERAKSAYPRGAPKNKWTVDRDGVLVATAGHVHTGGLWTDMWLHAPRRALRGSGCGKRATASSRASAARRRRRCAATRPTSSSPRAKYFEPAGPVSWDVAMTATPDDWRVAVKEGDTLEITTTYETEAGLLVRVDGDHGRLHGRGRQGQEPLPDEGQPRGQGHARPPQGEQRPRRQEDRAARPAQAPLRRLRRRTAEHQRLHLPGR